MSMTKRDLVVKVAKGTGLIQKDVTAVVQMTLDSIANEVALCDVGKKKQTQLSKKISRTPY